MARSGVENVILLLSAVLLGLIQGQGKLGGNLTRIAIQRAEPVGKFLGWKAMAPLTQWVVVKR